MAWLASERSVWQADRFTYVPFHEEASMRGRVHTLVLVLALAACGDHDLVMNAEPQEPPDNPAASVKWRVSISNEDAMTGTGANTATVTDVAVGSADLAAELLGSSSGLSVQGTYPPLTAYISGPRIITSPGMYTWTADVSGGDGNYTYRWDIHYIDVGGG